MAKRKKKVQSTKLDNGLVALYKLGGLLVQLVENLKYHDGGYYFKVDIRKELVRIRDEVVREILKIEKGKGGEDNA